MAPKTGRQTARQRRRRNTRTSSPAQQTQQTQQPAPNEAELHEHNPPDVRPDVREDQDTPPDVTGFAAPLHSGLPSVAQLVQEYCAALPADDPERALEQKALRPALELVGQLDQPDRPDQGGDTRREKLLLDELRPFAKSSRIAAFAVAAALFKSPLPKESRQGRKRLLALCDEGFPAAFAVLLQGVTAESLQAAYDHEVLQLAVHGSCRHAVLCCTLLFGRCLLLGVGNFPEDVRTILPDRLAYGAVYGSWEALRLLTQCYLETEPGFLVRKYVDHATGLLQQACEQDWPQALVLLGEVLLENTLVERNVPMAQKLFERALDKGSPEDRLDAAAGLARALMENENSQNLARARTVLAPGCESRHQGCLLAMAELLQLEERIRKQQEQIRAQLGRRQTAHSHTADTATTDEKVRELLAAVAEQGHAEPYVDYLWSTVFRDTAPEQKLLARDELARLAPHSPAALLKVGLWLLGNGFDGRVFPAFGDTEFQWGVSLGGCVQKNYAPAFAEVATPYIFGCFGFPRDWDTARKLCLQGKKAHNVRCLVLDILLDFLPLLTPETGVAGEELFDTIQSRFPQHMGVLQWAQEKNDRLARALMYMTILWTGKGRDPDRPASEDSRVYLFADYLADTVEEAMDNADTIVPLFLARQFSLGKNRRIVQRLAHFMAVGLSLEDRVQGPAGLAKSLVFMANLYGASHEGKFAEPDGPAGSKADKKPFWKIWK